ncbi:MAG: UDP-N-acetylmuramate--L-alanine ligase [Candidatus Berkelbacteria bacterium Licking1014_7]|uniref:UDP-N-acetylmuramate--L-alanine ligase n=1 Tax=Candidatus Berkelbacteria bacterium Licking1014_7 TaxID=2017147 RepID=A0A554LJL4_9BACT|nr:MAG: UDP-N-acetylmuramate--L-alanine ligase [Candidatus Berkelbacteria bacterium Licking1014_7]
MMKIYFVGIKGVGMAGLAVIAQEQGFEVSGSDVADEFITDKILRDRKITIDIGFDKIISPRTDLVIYTAAHNGKDNPQVKQATDLKIKVMSYGKAIAYFIRSKKVIAVSGTHGKTTTTAMIVKTLVDAGIDTGYLIGAASVCGLKNSAHWGKSDYFVVEADEYTADPQDVKSRAKFLYLNPYISIVLSTEYDHPDIYPNEKSYFNVYKKFVKRTDPKGLAIIRADEKFSQRLIKSAKSKVKIRPIFFQKPFIGLRLKFFGQHNLFNATVAAYVCRFLGVNTKVIKKSLNNFQGLQRRLELRFDGKIDPDRKVKIYDDYAHHPTEIQNALEALRSQYNRNRIICVFQSHTVSRTQALLSDFGKSFSEANKVLVAPIFLSAREKTSDFTGEDLAREISKHHKDTIYLDNFSKIIDFLQKEVKDNDVVVIMGAGDIYKIISNLTI